MSRRGWVLFALMGVLWGIPYLMIKVAVDSVAVPTVMFRGLGAAVLLPLAIRAGQPTRYAGTGVRCWRSPRWRSSVPGRCCRTPRPS